MLKREIIVVKRILQIIKVARSSDHVVNAMMISGDYFADEVIGPLEKLTGWKEEDEIKTIKLAEKFAEETRGHTLREKSEKIKEILETEGGIENAITTATEKPSD